MKIKIPKRIKVGVTRADIRIIDYIKNDDGWRGAYNQRTNVLQVDSQLKGDIRDRTFMHELVHLVDLNYEIGMKEDEISRLANGWLEIMWQLDIELDWSDIVLRESVI